MNVKAELKNGYDAQVKANVIYGKVLTLIAEKKVVDVNAFLYALYSDWPLKENGEKKGLSNTLKEHKEYMPAKYVNAFSVYRSRLAKKAEGKGKKKGGKGEGGKEKEVAVTATVRECDVPKYLALIEALAQKKGNAKAVALCKQLQAAFSTKATAKPVHKKAKKKGETK
jgi:hypothetical protein